MSVFAVSRGMIPIPPQEILINGDLDYRLVCTSISQQSGLGGLRASFEYPAALFDTDRRTLKDALVTVYICNPHDGSRPAYPDFVGYLDAENSSLSPRGPEQVQMSATSAGAYLQHCWVGQTGYPFSPSPDVYYPLRTASTGAATGWTPEKVLRDIFAKMPSRYRNRIALGDTDVIRFSLAAEASEMIFRNRTYASAIEYCLSFFGDVAFRERPGSGKVYLDFYRVNSHTAGVRSVRVAQWGENPTGGANVAEISDSSSVQAFKNKVQGFGSRKRFMIACHSSPVLTGIPSEWAANMTSKAETTVAKQLQRDWSPTYEEHVKRGVKKAVNVLVLPSTGATKPNYTAADTTFIVRVGAAISIGQTLQAKNGELMLVVGFTPATSNPKVDATVTVTRGYQQTTADAVLSNDQFIWNMPGIENVYRRYKLPACFAGLTKRKDNLKRRTNTEETPFKVQVWKYETILDKDENGTAYGVIQSNPTLIKDCSIDLDKNTITLAEPALVEYKREPNGDKKPPKLTLAETVVGVTFSFDANEWLSYATEVVDDGDVNLDIATDGLIERVPYDHLVYEQLTNHGYPIDGLEFDCLYFDENNGNACVRATAASIITDDSEKLQAECRAILQERCRRHSSRDIMIPWLTRGYSVGNQINVEGLNGQRLGEFVITGITSNVDPRQPRTTSLQIDNVKPPHRFEVHQ